MTLPARHPFLCGNYAPVADETIIADLAVEGAIPPALSGRYLRIGPNPIGNAPQPYDWSIGDGMVHAIALNAGRAVAYRNRWVTTGAASTKLGTEPVPGPRPHGTDTSNANIVAFGDRVLSLGDNALPYELTTALDTVRRVDLAGEASGMCAHPKTDPVTGELHVISSTDQTPQLHQVISSRGLPTLRHSLTPPASVRIHDLAVTRKHVVFFGDGIVGITCRHSDGIVHWLDTKADCDVHPITAYDDGDAICLYIAGPSLERWTLDPTAGDSRQHTIDETPHTLGRFNEQLLGSPPRYLYTVGAGADLPFDGTEIYKHDLVAETRQTHDFGPGRHPGEFLFVGDPHRDRSEDGGWLLGLVHDDASDTDDLVVLDAGMFDRPVVATVHVPRRIPYGLRGAWLPTRI
jgi:carotenoid cleavage dioxygenase-like enzyme